MFHQRNMMFMNYRVYADKKSSRWSMILLSTKLWHLSSFIFFMKLCHYSKTMICARWDNHWLSCSLDKSFKRPTGIYLLRFWREWSPKTIMFFLTLLRNGLNSIYKVKDLWIAVAWLIWLDIIITNRIWNQLHKQFCKKIFQNLSNSPLMTFICWTTHFKIFNKLTNWWKVTLSLAHH